MLSLAEQLLLAAIQEQKAGALNAPLAYGLTGAVLIDLLIRNKIVRLENRLAIYQTGLTNDNILNEALSLMTSAQRAENTCYWLCRLSSGLRHLKARLADRLRYKGFLTCDGIEVVPDKTELLSTVHGLWAPRLKRSTALLAQTNEHPRLIALQGLAKLSGLALLAEEEQWIASGRMKALQSEPLTRAVAEMIADMEQAARATGTMTAGR